MKSEWVVFNHFSEDLPVSMNGRIVQVILEYIEIPSAQEVDELDTIVTREKRIR